MTPTRILLACLMTLWLSGCVTAGSGSVCLTTSPTYLTAAEIQALTPETRRKILADNEHWAGVCR